MRRGGAGTQEGWGPERWERPLGAGPAKGQGRATIWRAGLGWKREPGGGGPLGAGPGGYGPGQEGVGPGLRGRGLYVARPDWGGMRGGGARWGRGGQWRRAELGMGMSIGGEPQIIVLARSGLRWRGACVCSISCLHS